MPEWGRVSIAAFAGETTVRALRALDALATPPTAGAGFPDEDRSGDDVISASGPTDVNSSPEPGTEPPAVVTEPGTSPPVYESAAPDPPPAGETGPPKPPSL